MDAIENGKSAWSSFPVQNTLSFNQEQITTMVTVTPSDPRDRCNNCSNTEYHQECDPYYKENYVEPHHQVFYQSSYQGYQSSYQGYQSSYQGYYNEQGADFYGGNRALEVGQHVPSIHLPATAVPESQVVPYQHHYTSSTLHEGAYEIPPLAYGKAGEDYGIYSGCYQEDPLSIEAVADVQAHEVAKITEVDNQEYNTQKDQYLNNQYYRSYELEGNLVDYSDQHAPENEKNQDENRPRIHKKRSEMTAEERLADNQRRKDYKSRQIAERKQPVIYTAKPKLPNVFGWVNNSSEDGIKIKEQEGYEGQEVPNIKELGVYQGQELFKIQELEVYQCQELPKSKELGDHQGQEIPKIKELGDDQDQEIPPIKRGPRCFTKVGIAYRRWYITSERRWATKFYDGCHRNASNRYRQG